MTFDAAAYEAEVRAMDAGRLLREFSVASSGFVELPSLATQKIDICEAELLRRLSGPVDREKLSQDLFHEINTDGPLGLPMETVKAQCESDANRIADLIESGKVPRKQKG